MRYNSDFYKIINQFIHTTTTIDIQIISIQIKIHIIKIKLNTKNDTFM